MDRTFMLTRDKQPTVFAFNDLGIATKMTLVLVSALLSLFILGTATLTLWLSKTQEEAHVDDLRKTNHLVLDMIEV